MKKLFLLILLLVPLLFNMSCSNEENKEVINYVVSFVNGDVLEEVTVNEAGKVSKPVDPVKDGFEFIGWYLNDELFNFESQIVSNITLNAKYKEVIKTYNVLVVFDNNEIKFNNITKLSLDDITKIDGYEYLSLYTDSLYQNEFDGNVTSNITLYLKYKKYHNVLLKTDKEEINLKVYHGEKIDTNIFYEKGYRNCIYYIDRNSLNMNANPIYYAEDEKVYTDIELTLVEGLAVSFYEEGLLKEKVIIESDSHLIEEGYRYKYSNYEFYLDEEYKNKFDFKTKITENTNIYLKPIKVDDTKVKVQINIKDSNDKVDYIQIFYIENGEYLDYPDIYYAFYEIYTYDGLSSFLYYDEEFTKVYNYEKIYNDLILYGYRIDCEPTEYVRVKLLYMVSNGDYRTVMIPRGSVLTDDYSLLTNGEAFDGFYYDSDGTNKYNYEPIYNDTRLYIKTKKFTENDKVHNIKIYCKGLCLYQNCLNELINDIDFDNKFFLYLDTVVEDGEIISVDRCRKPDMFYGLSIIGLYNYNTKSIYNGEPIKEDTVFILLTCFLGPGSASKYEWNIKCFNFRREYFNDYKSYLITYNDEDNNTLMFVPDYNQKIITIVDYENNCYQIFADVNTLITKEEILNVMNTRNINTENIVVIDIFVTEDVVIKVD